MKFHTGNLRKKTPVPPKAPPLIRKTTTIPISLHLVPFVTSQILFLVPINKSATYTKKKKHILVPIDCVVMLQKTSIAMGGTTEVGRNLHTSNCLP